VTTAHAITAAALANCLGTDSRTVLDRAFAGDDAFSPASAFCDLPFPTVLGVMPEIDRHRGRKGSLWIEPRDATRGGVNGPALPGQPPADGKISPLWIDEAALDCISTRLAMAALPSVRQLRPAVRAAVDRWGAHRVAYVFASSTGGLDETERALAPDPRLPLASAGYRYTDHGIDATSQAIARHLGVDGVSIAISTACSSSFHALASALRLIDRGLADAAVVGSADSLCRTTVFGFHGLGLTAPTATRPFARDRAGITLGEGSTSA
jgi:3-oxoacyl-[acyl-carrier-protein] synthase-1